MTEMEKEAIRLVGIEGWVPWKFQRVANGVLCEGAVCPLVTRGPRKGKPNYRKHDPATRSAVVVVFKEGA